jgi:hypothetical protein
MKAITYTLLIVFSSFLVGCKTTGSNGSGLIVKGEWKSDIHGDWNDLCRKMGYDPKKLGRGLTITGRYAPPTPRPPSQILNGPEGPYVKDGAGSWYGINYTGDTIYMPPGFRRWVLRHEVFHSVLRKLQRMGIACVVPGTDKTPGHWTKVIKADGTVVDAKSIVQTRWPAHTADFIRSLAPGGIRPQDTFKTVDDWNGILCIHPEDIDNK